MSRISWDQLHREIEGCQKCPLYATCTRKVPGQGRGTSPLMLIGEGPGQQEDRTGLAFVGPAGQLLTRMLKSINIDRKDVYITNVVKCRPPQNREPLPQEKEACLPYLRMQVALVKPKVILILGATAMKTLLGEEMRITRDHGKWFDGKSIKMLATFHPSALLRDEGKKRLAWEDLKILRGYLQQEKLFLQGAENSDG